MEPTQARSTRSCMAGPASESSQGTTSSGRMFRPWHDAPGTQVSEQRISTNLSQQCSVNHEPFNDKVKIPAYQHPVKLFWPKSKCYDFLYQDAEELLRNFPVQATISFYEETESDSDSEEEEFDN